MSASRHPGGEAPRSAGAAALRGAVLLAAAVVLGILLLQNSDGTGAAVSVRTSSSPGATTPSGGSGDGGSGSDTTVPTTQLVTSSTAPTIAQLRDPSTVKVLVANASGRSKAAARVSGVLERAGYTDQVAPGNARTNGLQSQVYAKTGYENEAAAIASLLSMAPTAVAPLSSSVPVADQGGAQIVVIGGVDVATRFQNEPLPSTTTG